MCAAAILSTTAVLIRHLSLAYHLPELVGLAGVFKDTGNPTTYPDLMMRSTPAETTTAGYLEALLRSSDLRRQIQALATGTSGSMVKISSPWVTGETSSSSWPSAAAMA
jgi:hypothetical protein